MTQIGNHNKENLSHALWSLLIKAIELLSPENQGGQKSQNEILSFKALIVGSTVASIHLNPLMPDSIVKLKKIAWLSNEQGNLHTPSKCFAPTPENREVLGNYVDYLHPDFNVSRNNETARWLAKKLEIHLEAAPSDYAHVIRKVASEEKAEDAEVRAHVEVLYGRLWQSLRKGDNWREDEKWQKEWQLTRKRRCWLGKKGDEWDFFFLHELVWKDDDYRYRLFKDKISFWAFDNDLLELAKNLDVKGCREVSDIEFNYYSDQGEDQIWSEKVQNLYPYIYDFLNSPLLCEQDREVQAAKILKRLSVSPGSKVRSQLQVE